MCIRDRYKALWTPAMGVQQTYKLKVIQTFQSKVLRAVVDVTRYTACQQSDISHLPESTVLLIKNKVQRILTDY